MPSLTAQQRQTAIDAIIHMEGMDGSTTNDCPCSPSTNLRIVADCSIIYSTGAA
jgi:hypothetical protein